MERTIQAIMFTKPDEVKLKTTQLPACGPRELICETIYTFVSPGTELRVLSGKQTGSQFPLIPGYSWVGRVIEIGREIRGWSEGELVTGRNPLSIPGCNSMWGGQASHHRVEVSGYDAVLKLPAGADPWSYIAVEVAAISWRGVSTAYPAPGETAVVIGQGLIGAFNALWLMKLGARVIVVDRVEPRLQRAAKWGVAATVNPNNGNPLDQLRSLCLGGADIVIESSASPAGVELANSIIRQPISRTVNSGYPQAQLRSNPHYWPRLVYQATYTHQQTITPGGLSGGEVCLISKPGDRTVDDRLEIIERVRRGELPLGDVVTDPAPVAEAPEAYFKLRDHPDKYNTIVYQWI